MALCVAKVPISFICRTVVELHDALSVSKTHKPLALIHVSCVYVGVFLMNEHFIQLLLILLEEQVIFNFLSLKCFHLVDVAEMG